MNTRKIREDLGRSRTCVQRRDFARAIYLFCVSLKELGGQTAPSDLRSDFRVALADICADPIFKKEYQHPLNYQPGNEKTLLIFLSKFYKQLMGTEDAEDYESTLQRKLNLDRCISDGKKFLLENKPSEADNCFAQAFKFYKDEKGVFSMMARSMMDAGHYVRALGYIKKGLAKFPEDKDLQMMAHDCVKQREKSNR